MYVLELERVNFGDRRTSKGKVGIMNTSPKFRLLIKLWSR